MSPPAARETAPTSQGRISIQRHPNVVEFRALVPFAISLLSGCGIDEREVAFEGDGAPVFSGGSSNDMAQSNLLTGLPPAPPAAPSENVSGAGGTASQVVDPDMST